MIILPKRPMKGVSVVNYEDIIFPCYGMPKIDGFRCMLSNEAWTSRLSMFPNLSLREQTHLLLPETSPMLDGEIVVGKRRGPGVLGRTSSGITSLEGDPDWKFWVFDCYNIGYGWDDRYTLSKQVVKSLLHPRIKILERQLLNNYEEFVVYLAWALSRGFEGVMTRSIDGPYKQGKSTLREQYLLKVKPFEDFEMRITGYYEEEANLNEAKKDATGKTRRSSAKGGKVGKGTLGGFTGIELRTGKPCKIGGGFSAQQRKDLWLRRDELVKDRAIAKGKKQVVGEKDAPRHPTFICLRPDFDITDY